MRTITVTGKGQVSVKPDTIKLRITTEGTYYEYEDTIRISADQTRILKETLASAGLDPADLKTTSFDINTAYESYKDKEGNYKSRFVGYKFSHRTYIKFENDNKILGRVLYAISKCPVEISFDIDYTVSNPEDAKNEMLKNAIADAKAKAKILAEAAEVELGQIEDISYSWSELHFTSSPIDNFVMEPKMMAAPDAYDIDIEADDIDLFDTVTVVWEIK